MWTSDPVWDAECYAAEQDRQTDRLPVCDCCGEPIQEDCAYKLKKVFLLYIQHSPAKCLLLTKIEKFFTFFFFRTI